MRVVLFVAFAVLLAMPAGAGGVPIRPDAHLTPGAMNPAITQATIGRTICIHGYTARKGIRHVTPAVKRAVFAEYGLNPRGGRFEVDHLVSLEIGGSNDLKNLWPESYTTKPMNAHTKDRLENRLKALVCAGTLPLAEAQHAIATNWIAAYRTYVVSAPLK